MSSSALIRRSGDTFLTLINDILDFSKIEAGQFSLEEQPFDLTQCIEDALDLLAPKASEKAVRVGLHYAYPTPRNVIGDVTRLRQILVNLVGNGVKFTDSGEVVVTVKSQKIARRPFPNSFRRQGYRHWHSCKIKWTGCSNRSARWTLPQRANMAAPDWV